MTGKEALIQVSKSCSGLALEFGNLKIGKTDNEALQTLKEIVVKYEKYKMVFEILKDNINMELICADYDFLCKSLYALDVYANKQIELTKKEAEVFGELLNGEEDK